MFKITQIFYTHAEFNGESFKSLQYAEIALRTRIIIIDIETHLL